MKPWEIEDLRRSIKGKWLTRTARQFNGKIATDSRKVAENELFFAIVGQNHDAHDFIPDVIARKPAAIIVHKEQSPANIAAAQANDVALLQVDNTIAALNRLAAVYRASPAMRATVIAVGGSNGKTTTKRIIHTLLSEKFGAAAGHASPKSFNNNIGMPLTMLEVEPTHEFVVLEIGTNAPGEIAALGEVCRPDIAVITNIGLEHLEKLGDLEGVAREEAAIAAFVADRGTLIIPAESTELIQALKATPAQKILVGRKNPDASTDAPGDLVLTDVAETSAGTTFAINNRGAFKIPLLGAHNAMNALMAIAVARRLGLTDDQISAGLAKVKPADMRLQPLQIGSFAILNDAYNANPSSMDAALRTFANLKTNAGRKVVILGDMLELGPVSDNMHRAVGALVAALQFDLFIAIGPRMALAAEVAAAASIPVARFPHTAAARAAVRDQLLPDDQILLKGSRGMALETLLDSLQNHRPELLTT